MDEGGRMEGVLLGMEGVRLVEDGQEVVEAVRWMSSGGEEWKTGCE